MKLKIFTSIDLRKPGRRMTLSLPNVRSAHTRKPACWMKYLDWVE
jgi:hypothetical protein